VVALSSLPYRNGFVPPPNARTPSVAPEAKAAEPQRSAALDAATPTSFSAHAPQTFAALAAPHRPDAISATVARLQRLFTPVWSGTTFLTEPAP
jgi:hypothetical protein